MSRLQSSIGEGKSRPSRGQAFVVAWKEARYLWWSGKRPGIRGGVERDQVFVVEWNASCRSSQIACLVYDYDGDNICCFCCYSLVAEAVVAIILSMLVCMHADTDVVTIRLSGS